MVLSRIRPPAGRRRPDKYLFGVGNTTRLYHSGHRAAGHRPSLAMAFQVPLRALARRYFHYAREFQLPLPVDDEPAGVVAADSVAMAVAEVSPPWRESESNTKPSASVRVLLAAIFPRKKPVPKRWCNNTGRKDSVVAAVWT